MQLPGFEPGPRTWQARIITKLYYNCSINPVEFSLLKRTAIFDIVFNLENPRLVVDEKLQEIIEKKINETLSSKNEISQIIKSLDALSTNNESFAYGIVIGRLYNSFYYQCRRVLKRSPTEQEFAEFIELLKKQQSEFLEKFG